MTNGNKKYMLVLMNGDGVYETDRTPRTKEEIIERLLKQNGQQIRYPFAFIVERDSSRLTKEMKIVDAPAIFSRFKGKKIKDVLKYLTEAEDKDYYSLYF